MLVNLGELTKLSSPSPNLREGFKKKNLKKIREFSLRGRGLLPRFPNFVFIF